MMELTEYLEAAKADELAKELEAQGYTVVRHPPASVLPVDLIATRNGRRIAFEVKARSHLRAAAHEIGKLRDAARAQGFDEFQLVVDTSRFYE